ncbi:hypothetical protein BHE74_00042480 [Ensete ventricosum]|nr:hypothetical protein BHE74_00042480 [Ensete ventricosum]
MRLLKFSPRVVIVVFVVAASILGVLTHYFLQGEAWIAADQKLGPVVRPLLKGPADPPVFAYWMSGTGGEGQKMLRLLKAVYHPRNRYLLHLDAGSSAAERRNLARSVRSERLFRAFGNVDVIGQSYAVDRTGPSVLAATLHGAAVLLRLNADWDWFISLSASDYPLVTQDGSPWVILSRAFVEHCIQGSDNLPRKLLMYFANVAYSMESYFQTVVCNSPEFQNTTVNNDLRYIVWDNPPGLEPLFLNQSHFKAMVKSRAAFARKFMEDDPVLKKVDKRILKRVQSGVGSGQWWCSSRSGNKKNKLKGDACSSWGDINVVKPGPSATRLKSLVAELISEDKLYSDQCKF